MTSKLLTDTGEALYGSRWRTPLAEDLGMSERHVRRIAAGDAVLTPGMATDLLRIASERAAVLDEVIERLRGASAP